MKIEIDKDLAKFIKDMCDNNGISQKGYVNNLLEKAIKQEIHRQMSDKPEEEIRSPNQRILDAIDILVGNSTVERWHSAQKANKILTDNFKKADK